MSTGTVVALASGHRTDRRPIRRPRRVVENDDFAAFAARIVSAHGRRVAAGDIEALAALSDLSAQVDAAITTAVTGLRAHGYSWADIGRRLGTSRQAAQQRWGTAPR